MRGGRKPAPCAFTGARTYVCPGAQARETGPEQPRHDLGEPGPT